jgi:hypothetical protein
MIFPDRLEKALARLSAAIRHLQAAADSRAQADLLRADLDEEFLLLQDDRARLAADLDAALAGRRALEQAGSEVAARLDRAGRTVEAVLAHLEPASLDAILSGPEGARASGRTE